MESSSLRTRLGRLVDVVFGGSAHAAALAAGVEPSTLHRLLEGKVIDPRLTTIRALAEAFGVPLGWLTGEMSTEAAQRGETTLPEPYWLLRSYHQGRQSEARKILRRHVAEEFSSFDLLPASKTFPLTEVARFLRALPEDDPVRIDLERRFVELETDLVKAAARITTRDASQTPRKPRRRKEG